METKPCRHCKQPIHIDARKCHLCQSNQSWLSDSRDIRFQFFMLGLLVLFFSGMTYKWDRDTSGSYEVREAKLELTDKSFHITKIEDGQDLVLIGEIENMSSFSVSGIQIRIKMFNTDGKMVDTVLMNASGLVIGAHQKAPVRVMAFMSVNDIDMEKTTAEIVKSKPATKWD